jgi:hypothetical protein
MAEFKNTFVEFIKESFKDDDGVCPYVISENRGIFTPDIRFHCSLVEDRLVFNNKSGENPCSVEDFNTCPLFPHGLNK